MALPAPFPPDCLCAGAAHWDVIGRAALPAARGDDLPGRVLRRPGGVALNIARALAAAGRRPALLAAVGSDAAGRALVAATARAGVATGFVLRPRVATDAYVAVEDGGGLVAAVADTGLLDGLDAGLLAPLADGRLATPGRPWRGPVVIDGNLAPAFLAALAAAPVLAAADLRLVAASPAKAARLAAFAGRAGATLYLNRAEAAVLLGRELADAPAAARALAAAGLAGAIVTDGGAPLAEAAGGALRLRRPPATAVQGVTGAGDAFVAAHLAAEMAGADPEAALDAAVAAATLLVAGAAAR
ncbi:MAG: kinase [Rhodobacteraceae bacterium]|nr:kinase [Paracoccaceae bacterium]